MERGILVSSSKSLIHTCTNIYTVWEYLRTYLHHWAFVVLQYSAIQTKCFKLCINRFRAQRGILCVWDPEDNTGFSPASVKLGLQLSLRWKCTHPYKLGVLIPIRVNGAWTSYIWGTSDVRGIQPGLASLARGLQDCGAPLEQWLGTRWDGW